MSADAWELRTARLEGAYEQIDRRLGAVEGRLATLEQKMDTGFAQIRAELSGVRNASHAEIGSLRDVLQAEIGSLQGGLQAEIGNLRGGLQAEIGNLRGGLQAEIGNLRGGLQAEMRRQFYWLLGVMLSGFLAIGLKLASH